MVPGPRTRIAGAGLAGLTTAIGLAQSHLLVDIFEAAPDSGWARRGAWDAVENWSTEADFTVWLDRWRIARGFDCRPVHSFDVYDPRGECHSITTARPILYLVKRGNQPGALEYTLKDQVLNCGVTVQYNQPCCPQEVDVWATGAHRDGQFLAAGLRFQTRHPDTVKLLISAGHAPKAYAYLFIVDGQGVLSVLLTRNFPDARLYLQRSLEFFRHVGSLEIKNACLTSGFGGQRADFWKSKTKPLRVGEAAGFQDYLWGFGIRYALQSGYLAAQAIAQGTDYHRAVHAQIHPLVYSSMINRAVYNRVGDRVYPFLIRQFSRSPHLIDLLRRCYRASIPQQLLWPLRQTQPD